MASIPAGSVLLCVLKDDLPAHSILSAFLPAKNIKDGQSKSS